jgi:integrase/recombinase XerD
LVMKQQTMTVLFYLNKAKTNQKGVCPIYCRITFLKKRKQFSTGQFVNPKHWSSKSQSV